MKVLLRSLLTLFLLSIPLSALAQVSVTLAWDANTGPAWSNVRIYEKIGTTYTMKVEVAGTVTQAIVTGVMPGVHTFIARSYAATVESADSNVVSNTVAPGSPSNLRIIIVQVAEDGTLTFKALTIEQFKSLYGEEELARAQGK